jgi:hypothetical protein
LAYGEAKKEEKGKTMRRIRKSGEDEEQREA